MSRWYRVSPPGVFRGRRHVREERPETAEEAEEQHLDRYGGEPADDDWAPADDWDRIELSES